MVHNQYLPHENPPDQRAPMLATSSNFNYFATAEQNAESHLCREIEQDEQRLREIVARVEQLRAEALERLASRGRDHAGVLQQSLVRDVELNQ